MLLSSSDDKHGNRCADMRLERRNRDHLEEARGPCIEGRCCDIRDITSNAQD